MKPMYNPDDMGVTSISIGNVVYSFESSNLEVKIGGYTREPVMGGSGFLCNKIVRKTSSLTLNLLIPSKETADKFQTLSDTQIMVVENNGRTITMNGAFTSGEIDYNLETGIAKIKFESAEKLQMQPRG